MRKINTYKQLLDYAFDLLDRTKTIEPAEIKGGLDFTIKIKGKSWDGFIDWRLAKFILDMQKAVNKIFKDSGLELSQEEKNALAIKFKISEGCSLIEIKPGKAIQALLDKMTGKQKTALGIILILAVTSYLTYGRFIDYKSQIESKTQDEITKRELIQLSREVSSRLDDYEKPMRRLVAKLNDNDTIIISSRNVELTKEQLKKDYPHKPKSIPKTVYIDGTYVVTSIRYPGDSVRITIESGANRIDCGVALSEEDLASLYEKAKEQHHEGCEFEMPLKITAKFSKTGGIKDAVIFGLGAPRDKSINLTKLYSKVD